MLHNGVSPLKQQVDHHRNVVPQEDLSVVQRLVVTRMLQGSHAPCELPADLDQGALEMLASLLNNLIFFRTRTEPLILLCEAGWHRVQSPFWEASHANGFRQWKRFC